MRIRPYTEAMSKNRKRWSLVCRFVSFLFQTTSLEWKRVVFDPLMSTEGRLNDVLRQEAERAIDRGDAESKRFMLDMMNSLFALMLDIVEPVMERPPAINEHIEPSSLDPSGPTGWPYASESTSLDVLAVYLTKVIALPPPFSSVVLSRKDLNDCVDRIR